MGPGQVDERPGPFPHASPLGWDAANDGPPSLFGRNFALVGAGNRYGLPPFYQLHVWLWRPNPSGIFNDWNPKVSCRGQGDPA